MLNEGFDKKNKSGLPETKNKTSASVQKEQGIVRGGSESIDEKCWLLSLHTGTSTQLSTPARVDSKDQNLASTGMDLERSAKPIADSGWRIRTKGLFDLDRFANL